MALWSFNQLLAYGRTNLIRHRYSPGHSPTNIEDDLKGIYLDQMIELNKFIYTTASTNDPHNSMFQPMFISGYMPLSKAYALINDLNDFYPNDYYYIVYSIEADLIYEMNIFKGKDPDYLLQTSSIHSLIDYERLEVGPHNHQVSHLLYTSDPLVMINIEDKNKERRDLYAILISLLSIQ